ncbi:MAG: hypothetical protein QW521_02025 [Desulfurococcaceae archaeon]
MKIEACDGCWREVITPSLKRKIRRVETLRVLLHIDNGLVDKLHALCGTSFRDCPFRYPHARVSSVFAINGYCLAPTKSKEWRKIAEEVGVEATSNVVRGCFIYVYNLLGYKKRMEVRK